MNKFFEACRLIFIAGMNNIDGLFGICREIAHIFISFFCVVFDDVIALCFREENDRESFLFYQVNNRRTTVDEGRSLHKIGTQ